MNRRYICYIRAIATAGSCAMLLVLGWPMADEYLGHRKARGELATLREECQELEMRMASLSARHEVVTNQLGEYQKRAITNESLATFRDAIVEMVRTHEARIRQISVEEHTERPWRGPEDDPLVNDHEGSSAEPSEYNLLSARLSLTVTGEFSHIRALCTQIEREGFLSATEFIALQPVDALGQVIQLEMRIRFFGLDERKPEDMFDMLPPDVAGLTTEIATR